MITRLAVAAAILLLTGLIGLGIYWSQEPAPFDVAKKAQQYRAEKPDWPETSGTATTLALTHLLETLLNKPGGFISNDIMPPGVWLDNISNWEYGVLSEARAGTQFLRDTLARVHTEEDKDLLLASSRLNISHQAWAFPGAESEYRDGITHLYRYLDRLNNPASHDAVFLNRHRELLAWLDVIDNNLNKHIRQLNASVPAYGDDDAQQATHWLEVDDYFYQARGASWALLHIFQALEADFADVLADYSAAQHIAAIQTSLQACQQTLRSPMVLNGKGFGLWANHSLTMTLYLSQAQAALREMKAALQQTKEN